MQITCLGCGSHLTADYQRPGAKVWCARCNTLVDVPSGQPSANPWGGPPQEASPTTAPEQAEDVPVVDPIPSPSAPPTGIPAPVISVSRPGESPYASQPSRFTNRAGSGTSISDTAIIITAVACLFGLIFVVGTAIFWRSSTQAAPELAMEVSDEAATAPIEQRTTFQEGYSIALPAGFTQQSRDETQQGDIVYRFRSEKGYRFTFGIFPDESIGRFTNPPRTLAKSLIKSVPEFSEGVDADITPFREMADGMPASIFFYYEKETYRGVTFTYYMVAIDRGRKLALKFSGKYGDYSETDESIVFPDHWNDALLSLRHEKDPSS